MTRRVLLVDDAPSFRKMVASYLERQGWEVYQAWSLAAARRMLPTVQPHLMVLDIELGDGEGLALLEEPSDVPAPAIILSTHNRPAQRIVALRLGARDYMVKAVELEELHLRMLRIDQETTARDQRARIDYGAFVLDLVNRRVLHAEGTTIELSPSEFQLLSLFLTVGDRVLSREAIALKAFGRVDAEESRAVDVLVSKLRRKLDPSGRASPIVGVRGEGYRFTLRPRPRPTLRHEGTTQNAGTGEDD